MSSHQKWPRPKRQTPWTSLPLVSLLLSGLILPHCPAFLLSLGPSTASPVVQVSLQGPFMCTGCLLFLDILASCAGLQGAGDCTPTPCSFYSFNLGTGSHARLASSGSGSLDQ